MSTSPLRLGPPPEPAAQPAAEPREPAMAFSEVPLTARQHFVLHLYAAVHHLLCYLRATSDPEGARFKAFLDRYPFLGAYLAEIAPELPAELPWSAVPGWWRGQLARWEQGARGGGRDEAGHLPLRALAEELELDFSGRMALVLAGLVEEDSRFGTVFHELQAPLPHRRPTLDLLGRLAAPAEDGPPIEPWTLSKALVGGGLLSSTDPSAPVAEWPVRWLPALWAALRGERPERPLPGCRYLPAEGFPTPEELLAEPELAREAAALPAVLSSGAARFVVLRCDPGADGIEVLGAVAARLGRGVLEVEQAERMAAPAAAALGPLATLLGAMPVLRFEPAPGEKVEPPELTGYRGPAGLVLGFEGGVSDRVSARSVSLRMAMPDAELRRRLWQRALAGRPLAEPDTAAERFHLSGRFITRVARSAAALADLDGRQTLTMADLQRAATELNRHLLDNLADRLDTPGNWGDLAVVTHTCDQLAHLERRCHHRERLLGRLGPAFRNGANRGVRALFTGPSGTGKTLAAKILAGQLQMDLYRVDLAAIVNKYIGETEKNLQQVLARAEALDVVLLLDEGDSLLGGRTEVKSATDRYANLETNYLLQRLEHYQGIVLVTTNLGDNIDRAFRRRMDVVVPFFAPSPEERARILDLHLPEAHQIDPALLDLVALRCDLNGGQLRNVAMQACLLALDDGDEVAGHHLEAALRSEYRKAGGTFPLAAHLEPVAGRDGGMSGFMTAMAGH